MTKQNNERNRQDKIEKTKNRYDKIEQTKKKTTDKTNKQTKIVFIKIKLYKSLSKGFENVI